MKKLKAMGKYNLKSRFLLFNKRYFGDRLPKDVIVHWWAQEGLYLGDCHVCGVNPCGRIGERCAGHEIRISDHIQGRRFSSIAEITLLHEMVHMKAALGDYRFAGHGPTFHREMKRLAALGAFSKLW